MPLMSLISLMSLMILISLMPQMSLTLSRSHFLTLSRSSFHSIVLPPHSCCLQQRQNHFCPHCLKLWYTRHKRYYKPVPLIQAPFPCRKFHSLVFLLVSQAYTNNKFHP